ncbi:hypothetical protein [Amycolatopsis pithecellobii]|uniref:Uncharacterized protein n=1 Tax=Amycolatopsis pithecellobii TaxID=664692 RepID=A0A6N7YPR0_9PSEU|nr:hypothetical protein [Amycolatopsis pithecellobii]MTD53878.1 hypothetical protein [Amycolatopsis pithecellobii]
MVTEIQNIITAANAAYQRFAATNPDRETRVSVSNAVRFLVADLTSVAEYAAGRSE